MPVSKRLLLLVNLGSALVLSQVLQAEVIVLPAGEKTEWRYLDDGTTPNESWTGHGFDDSTWQQGAAPLGYGAGTMATTLSFGSDSDAKHVTSYFRTSVMIDPKDKDKIEKLGFRLRRDDGAVIYLNGREVARSNMPAGAVNAKTLAASAIGGNAKYDVHEYLANASALAKQGPDIVAVEIHQANPRSGDIYLDLEINGYRAGEAPERDLLRDGMAAFNRRDYVEAAELLRQLKPNHPRYAKTMAFLAHRIYCDGLGRAIDGLPFAKKAYDAAPEDRDVVQGYLRTHVLSGVLFDDQNIARARQSTVAKEHQFLVSKPDSKDDSRKYSRAQLEEDLNYLEHILVNCFAYLEIRDVDYRAALDAIRLSLDDETPVNSFELQIAKLISLFCDGHATVAHHSSQYLPRGYAPYVAGQYRGRVYLYDPKVPDFLDPKHPYVTAIDGRPIDEWIGVAGYIVVKDSPQLHRLQSLKNLRYVNYLRAELGLPREQKIRLQFESEDRKGQREMTVSVQQEMLRGLAFPRIASRRFGDIGYLRIPGMTSNRQFLSELDDWMDKFRDTDGLIIDLRGNRGGTKHVLYKLFPYFMQPDAPMRILELSVYRKPMELPKPNPGGFMRSDMSGQPITSSRWKNDAQRRQVAGFIRDYRTEWQLPKGKFTEWHLMAIDASMNPKSYYYDKPLIVLQDSRSFSGSDIFLGAFEDHPNTTLMGQPSAGANGWMEIFRLPNSRLKLILCQSAKFRPNGKLYDGEGIHPDVFLEATPQDVFGKSDSVLVAAVRQLKRAAHKAAANKS